MGTALSIAGGLILYKLIFGILQGHLKRDSTDAEDQRSGMNSYIDHGTGVHYLGTPEGGITPRLKADGSLYTRNDFLTR